MSYAGHVLMENRNGLVMQATVTQANGTAERDAALTMAEQISGEGRVTLGADKITTRPILYRSCEPWR